MTITSHPIAEPILSESDYLGFLPPSFLYGAASAAFQVEGAYDEDGKAMSVWDVTLRDAQDSGNVACDSYHLFREDVQLLRAFGCRCYRFSIAWTRVVPGGFKDAPVNEAGIAYYNALIDALIEAGITPMATIFHFDTPQILQDAYGGFRSDKIVPDFVYFASTCFERFGDRVRHWCTINEPLIYGMHSADGWDKATWNYEADSPKVVKYQLLAHARTVEVYRKRFQNAQEGVIGIALNSNWCEPVDDSAAAKKAAQVLMDYALGMYAEPIYLGAFPDTCTHELGDHAPSFTDDEWAAVRGSSDFFGLNSYSTSYALGPRIPKEDATSRGWTFGRVQQTWDINGKVIGNRGHDNFPYDVPWGFRKLLQYIHARFTRNTVPIIITENGFAPQDEGSKTLSEAVQDVERQRYYAGYLKELFDAIRVDGIRVDGYIAWSLTDNIEWYGGWKWRFGLAAIDHDNGLQRVAKDSGYMLKAIFDHAIQ